MSIPIASYKKGDFIGQEYEVCGILGCGGFGVVYLVYSHQNKTVCALKTFRDEYLEDTETRELFREEAAIWVNLERHPFLVRAHFLDEVAGRLYIAMEYIAPNESGLNSLDGYLEREPPDLALSLRWAIQFCHGMEYAYSRGMRCHLDIKPANVMISTDKTVKISDFGLARILSASKIESKAKLNVQGSKIGLSIWEGKGFGTPTHMPPEQFISVAECDERSDIYSFGIVLYQMVTGGTLPFVVPPPRDDSEEQRKRFSKTMYRLHSEAPVPRVASPLFNIIQRCLEKEQDMRYQTFKQLRADLEPQLKNQTGETVKLPEPKELEAWELSNKGASLNILGRFSDAIGYFDRANKTNPQLAQAWTNKGISLHSLGYFVDAIRCFDRAIQIDPQDERVWSNKGKSFASLGRFIEAIACLDEALRINPLLAGAWNNKGACLHHLGRFAESIKCCDKAVEIQPRFGEAWYNKGNILNSLGSSPGAIECYRKAIEINPQYASAWTNIGASLARLGRFIEAMRYFDKAVEIKPQLAEAWHNRGSSLAHLGHFEEALRCFDRAVEINPQNPEVWFSKALGEDRLNRNPDAVRSYWKFIELASAQYAWQVEYALQRARELEKR